MRWDSPHPVENAGKTQRACCGGAISLVGSSSVDSRFSIDFNVSSLPERRRGPVVAFGPETPGWGSWEWVGRDLADELAGCFQTICFGWDDIPKCDLLFVIKHPLPAARLQQIPPSTQIVYCPVDRYGSAAEIDADSHWLRRCTRIVVHCERLRRWFAPYATVEYMDHHVKYVGQPQAGHRAAGPILWVGVRSNLPPLVEWVNAHRLPADLCVLTNLEDPHRRVAPSEFGFRSSIDIQIENWTASRHLELLSVARAALDIKGSDFRSRHKPPTKAIDFIAAGLPLAMNVGTSSAEHLARLGFEVARPEDTAHWLSYDYWTETQRFGQALREMLSLQRIGRRYRMLVEELTEAEERGVTSQKFRG